MKLNKPLIIMSLCAAFVVAMVGSVVSQSPGLLAPGFVLGNGSATNPSSIAPYSVSSIMDQGLGNVSGNFARRGASNWTGTTIAGTDVPAATSGSRGGVFTTDFRPILTANRNYFVRTDGNNSNDCLSNTSGGACLTMQGAIDKAVAVDNGGFTITINVADGTYGGATTLKRAAGNGAMQIVGNTTTPANVLVDSTSATPFTCSSCGVWSINGFKTRTQTAGFPHVFASGANAQLTLINWIFDTTNGGTGTHISLTIGGKLVMQGNYTISGAAAQHYLLSQGSFLQSAGATITITGTPAWATAFIVASQTSVAQLNANTYSGASTGSRFNVSENAVVSVNGGGANYLPGNAAGTTATGGQYN